MRPSMLEAVETHVSPGGMAWTLPTVRSVMSAATSDSKQSQSGFVSATRAPALAPYLSRTAFIFSTHMVMASS